MVLFLLETSSFVMLETSAVSSFECPTLSIPEIFLSPPPRERFELGKSGGKIKVANNDDVSLSGYQSGTGTGLFVFFYFYKKNSGLFLSLGWLFNH